MSSLTGHRKLKLIETDVHIFFNVYRERERERTCLLDGLVRQQYTHLGSACRLRQEQRGAWASHP